MFFAALCFIITGCKSFKHGLTWDKAKNTYQLVIGNKNNFGDQRLDYNKSFHRNSALSNFLDCRCNDRGLPAFIYEYQTASKCRGIKLYYPAQDSVFVFEEPEKAKLQSILREARKMNEEEKKIFQGIKKKG